jgi:hypothetical protein
MPVEAVAEAVGLAEATSAGASTEPIGAVSHAPIARATRRSDEMTVGRGRVKRTSLCRA